MKRKLLKVVVLGVISLCGLASGAEAEPDQAEATSSSVVQSSITQTEAGERVVTQQFTVEASVAEVWRRFTTAEGWTSWASPHAEIDLRAGGTIRTHYGPDAKIGDPGTNVLHILNYVPERLLTLQAELAPNWPEVMKQDAEHLMNVLVFEPLDENRTRVTSYGLGYGDSPAYDSLLDFFVPANEKLYEKLAALVASSTEEQSDPSDSEGVEIAEERAPPSP